MTARTAIFLFFFSLYLLTAGGHFYSTDEETMFQLTASMLRRGEFNVPSNADAPVSAPPIGLDGRRYSQYGILPSALALPLLGVGNGVSAFFPRFYNGFIIRFGIAMVFNPLFTALTATVLFVFFESLGFAFRPALATVVLYGIGSMAWVYSKTFFSEPLATFLLLLAFYSMYLYGKARHPSSLFASGLCVGLAAATKIGAVIAAPLFFLYLLSFVRERKNVPEIVGAAFVWVLPFALMLFALALYNVARFGNPFETGYRATLGFFATPLATGLYGLVLSPGKSLFLYSPVALLFFSSICLFARRDRPVAFLCTAFVLVHILFYAAYSVWHGDSAWGPRFMIFILPFLLLPVAALVEKSEQTAHRTWRAIIAAVFAFSLLIQFLGLAINWDIYINSGVPERVRHFDPYYSPLIGQLQVLNSHILPSLPARPMPDGSIARFGWFFDPAFSHPLDFWFLYIVVSGMPSFSAMALILPLSAFSLAGLFVAGRQLVKLWQSEA